MAALPVLLTLDSEAALPGLSRAGVDLRGVVGRVASASVASDALDALAALEGVRRVSLALPFRLNLDVNAVENGAAAARAEGASGAGVLVAILDSGIDFRHADFRDASGATRVRFLWDQFDDSWASSGGMVGSPPPAGGEGTVYTAQQLDAALASEGSVATVDLPGHGSLVASAAAGNGRATGNEQPAGVYLGAAPEAELLVVKLGGESATDLQLPGDVVAALEWVDARAAELGLPVVVNMSFGGHIGPHDGTSPEELAIDAFVARPGRAVVVSAGNEGDKDVHASGSTLGGHTVEVFQAGEDEVIVVDCWIPGEDLVGVGFTDPSGRGVPDLRVEEESCGSSSRAPNAVTACVGGVDPINGDREILFIVEPTSGLSPISAGRWKFHLLAEDVTNGRFDCWSANEQRFVTDVDPSMRVSQPGTARGAVTAGALVARNRWPGQAGEQRADTEVGSLASFSSPGPTRDGRGKPDLVTGGQVVLGAWSIGSGTGSGIAGVPPRPDLVASDGVHVASRGTSFSAPQVSGAVALLFERNPTLTGEQVRAALAQSARSDAFTGDVPNDQWGFGKLDVGAALAQVSPVLRTPTPSATPTSTATPTATRTPTPSSTPSATATVTPTQIVSFPGDSDCDGSLGADDVSATWAGIFDAGARCSSDCNRDGRVDAADLLCVEGLLVATPR